QSDQASPAGVQSGQPETSGQASDSSGLEVPDVASDLALADQSESGGGEVDDIFKDDPLDGLFKDEEMPAVRENELPSSGANQPVAQSKDDASAATGSDALDELNSMMNSEGANFQEIPAPEAQAVSGEQSGQVADVSQAGPADSASQPSDSSEPSEPPEPSDSSEAGAQVQTGSTRVEAPVQTPQSDDSFSLDVQETTEGLSQQPDESNTPVTQDTPEKAAFREGLDDALIQEKAIVDSFSDELHEKLSKIDDEIADIDKNIKEALSKINFEEN
ncbi:MAG: hypothetical protein ACQESG_03215, partial [Nanobdellota archaeon]